MIGTRIHITGIVQGVGFRPFIFNQASSFGLVGWVCNTSSGVDIEVHGEAEIIRSFIQAIYAQAPPLSRIDSLEQHEVTVNSFVSFEILPSVSIEDAFQPISPDICICPDCLRELLDPQDRRYHYPFINCTNCGPRLTIIEGIPYDRPYTTMKEFEMCEDCSDEYTDPTNRRFHAQPIACPTCGPQIWLEPAGSSRDGTAKILARGEEALQQAQKLLKNGKVVAIKGLGGFHLACDATNTKAVQELRQRKLRVDKPFALMMPEIQTVEAYCQLEEVERSLLESRERPIVILNRKINSKITPQVSPGQNTIGVMLPYTPLHYLLFAPPSHQNGKTGKPSAAMPPLVMTSGNISEEPIALNNEEARTQLVGLADAFLMHDRAIRTRCDDSVMRTFRNHSFPLRRSRGYAPFPVYLAQVSPQVLAVGGELKNTFCLTRDKYAFLSHHIGDMQNAETYDAFEDSVAHYESLFRIKPDAIAYDLHPNYLSTRYAQDRSVNTDLPAIGVQHHHAHIAACMAENSIPHGKSVIGVAFDGTGYGSDGAIWGGEFLLAGYEGFIRRGHVKYYPLPGGDAATRKPARIALAYLWASKIEWEPEYPPVAALCPEERTILRSMLSRNINTPLTSSMGRLFDAAASIADVRQQVNYEAQAAIEFEAVVDPAEDGEYGFSWENEWGDGVPLHIIDPAPVIYSLVDDTLHGIPPSKIAARFHRGVARMVQQTCHRIWKDTGVQDVVLSGGVWQNLTLLNQTIDFLSKDRFNVYYHSKVPANDGGLALGQAVIAIERLNRQKTN